MWWRVRNINNTLLCNEKCLPLLNERFTRLIHYRSICNHRADILRDSNNKDTMQIIPAILENITSRKDKTWKLVFGTNECTPDQIKEIVKTLNDFVFLAMKKDSFKTEETEILENLESGYEGSSKSQAQRIRSVLFLLWKQGNGGYEDFNMFYQHHTENYITHLKNKLDP